MSRKSFIQRAAYTLQKMNVLSAMLWALMRHKSETSSSLPKTRYYLHGPDGGTLKKWIRQASWLPLTYIAGVETKNIGPADALSLIRCLPGEDATNGFFVSCFVKRLHPMSRKRKEITGDDCVEVDTPKPHKKKKKRAKVKNVWINIWDYIRVTWVILSDRKPQHICNKDYHPYEFKVILAFSSEDLQCKIIFGEVIFAAVNQ